MLCATAQSCPGPPPTHTSHSPICPIVIADSGCTAHFCTTSLPVTHKRIATRPIAITNPNGTQMVSSHTAYLDLPDLPLAARLVHIVPALTTKSLLSIPQLCTNGCKAELDNEGIRILRDGKLVLAGTRCHDTGLWHIDVTNTVPTLKAECESESVEPIESHTEPPFSANAAAGSSKPADLVAFAHAALWSPSLSTLEKALDKGYISNIPGLSQQSLRKYPPNLRATMKGHLDQQRQGTGSTKKKSPPEEDFEFPFEITANDETQSHECFAALIPPTGQIYTDQTGRFVCPSETGNNYLMVLYDYDSNAILAEAIPNRNKKSLLAAFTKMHAQLCAVGLRPKYQRLDNECSDIMKEFMTEQQIKYQLVPPDQHRRNAAERAIRTLKNHLIAGFCSLDENFPLTCWDKTLPHALMAINLLRGSRINPKLSAYAQIHGAFDFNATPMAPPGIRVLIHEKPQRRKTWMPHAVDGWYLGPAMEHYRCHRVWCWTTKAERVCDTLSWFPTKVQIPTASSADTIQACLQQIVVCLQNPAAGSPLAPLTNTHVEALSTIQRLIVDPPSAPTEPKKPEIIVETVVETADKASAVKPNPTADPPTAMPTIAPSLRVTAQNGPTNDENMPTTNLPTTTTISAPSLRVTAQNGPADATAHDSTTARRSNRNRRTPKKFVDVVAAATAVAVSAAEPSQKPSRRRTAKHKHHSAKHRANCAIIEEAIMREITEHMALLGNAINPDTGASAEYNELINSSAAPLWIVGNTKEIRRLLDTNTMRFISIKDIPKGIKPTYLRIVCAFRPEKEDPYRVRWTIGGDRIIFHGEVSTKAADITTVKAHLNSVVSTPNAKFCGTDVKDFYLNTPLNPKDFAYMRIPIKVIPKEIMDEYNLWELVHNDAVYVEVRKGMYGLKQAGRIANDQLTEFLAADGYAPVPITPGLWRHETRDISFTLVVDDFGIKYTNQDDLDHLLASLRKHYTISVDLTGSKYLGLDIAWDYTNRTCDISMPGYIERALLRFQHASPAKPQDSPHYAERPIYGAAVQLTAAPDHSPPLSPGDTKRVQEILGTLLYYARAVDCTMLPAIGSLASEQAKGTKNTMRKIVQLLNYCASHPDAVVRYTASDMVLHVESDASYQSETKARSRVAGYHYLGPNPAAESTNGDKAPDIPTNGPVTVISHILNVVVSSAAEAETAGLYYNCREACAIRTCLEEMGHPQPATPVVTDNSTAVGICTDTIKQRCSKAMDMRFYWVRDRVRQKQFKIHWKKGSLNHADYFSKHHPAPHHRAVRSTFLYDPNNPRHNHFAILQDAEPVGDENTDVSAIPVRGCVDISRDPRIPSSPGLASNADPRTAILTVAS
jgi:hypothetical protein